jgi:hypothetical protein
MKIEFITRGEEYIEACEYRDEVTINIDGKQVFSVQDDEPEDSNLSRSFSDCYGIVDLMKRAYEAGKAGESFIIKNIELGK